MKLSKKLLSVLLCALMVLSSVAVGGEGFAEILEAFSVKASAETSGIYTYSVYEGEAKITGCDINAAGSITIPSTLGGYPVTSIGGGAFENCTGLTSVTIPDSVTEIGSFAFAYCTGLTSVTIGNGVTSIGDYAFEDCTGLTSVTIGSGVTSIGDCAFYKCTSLTSITIPNSVTSIGGFSFSGCTGLTSITIPDSVTSIGSSAFYYCTGLTSVTIGNGVTSIGDYAFEDCTGLTSITIPNSVTSIGKCAFAYCTGLTEINWNAKSCVDFTSYSNVFCYAGTNGTGINVVFGNSVEKIPAYLFYISSSSCRPQIKSITIGNNVTSIGDNAFYGCTGLTSVTIGNGVTSIGDHAFDYCTGLTSVTIGNGVTSIGSYAFEYCTGLTSVTIPASVTVIGNRAFENCTGLTSITIGSGVKEIPGGAFDNTGYYNDESNWENGVLYIGNYLIEAKKELTGDYTIKAGTKAIAEDAFSGCTGLTSITIPDSVTSFDFSDLIGNRALKTLNIGAGIPIDDIATAVLLTSLEEINVSPGNETCYSKNGVVYKNNILVCYPNSSKIKTFDIPDGIEYCLINSAKNLEQLNVPAGVKMLRVFSGENFRKYKIDPQNKYYFVNNEGVLIQKGMTIEDVFYPLNTDKVIGELSDEEMVKFKDSLMLLSANAILSGISSDPEIFLISRLIPYVINLINLALVKYDEILDENLKEQTIGEAIGTSTEEYISDMSNIFDGKDIEVQYTPEITMEEFVISDSNILDISKFVTGAPYMNVETVRIESLIENDGIFALIGFPFFPELKTVYLDESVSRSTAESISMFGASKVKAVVAENNPNICSDSQGAIYDKEVTELLFYPYASAGKTFVMPETVAKNSASYLLMRGNLIQGLFFSGLGGMKTYKVANVNLHVTPEQFDSMFLNYENDTDTYDFVGVSKVCSDVPQEKIDAANAAIEEAYAKIWEEWNNFTDEEKESFNTIISNLLGISSFEEYAGYIRDVEFVRCDGNHENEEEVEYNFNSKEIDSATGIELEYQDFDFNGNEVDLVVKNDTANFNQKYDLTLLDFDNVRHKVYDISLYSDGEKVQPDGKVLVRIPVPEDYAPYACFVYYIDDDGNKVNMHAVYKDGFMEFEASHFSYYALVEEIPAPVEEIPAPTANVKLNVASAQTVDYRSIVTITATATNVPEGYKLAIYLGSQKVAEGDNKSVSYTHGELKSDLNYSVKVIDANGNVQKDSNGNELTKDGGKITCNAGFFKKLIAFFKGLFKKLPTVEVKP